MLEETNRVVCDHCSDFLFVYHKDYQKQLAKEGIKDNVYVVGNTIVEVCSPFYEELKKEDKRKDQILVDIHRPENFKYPLRMANIIQLTKLWQNFLGIPVKWLGFPRTMKYLQEYGISLDGINVVDLMSYKQFLREEYHSLFMISDSGTAQEEPAILGTPVIVPRDFTERPQSMKFNCSRMINVLDPLNLDKIYSWLLEIEQGKKIIDSSWLGDGKTSQKIVDLLKEK
jgi:UDP-N-acetylglucosamine 2-epimerase (non-hydrolysing)